MPTTVDSDNFDSATVPAWSAGWTTNGGAVTSTTTPLSSPNCVTGGATASYNYKTILDGNGGDQRSTIWVRPNTNAAGPMSRITVVPNNSAGSDIGGSYYVGIIDTGSGSRARLFKKVTGTTTQLGSTVTAGVAFVTTDYHLVRTTCNGTTITLEVQRPSDSNWLTSAGGWSATPQACITVTDGAVTGAGYAGVQVNTTGARVDDWLYESLATAGTGGPFPFFIRARMCGGMVDMGGG